MKPILSEFLNKKKFDMCRAEQLNLPIRPLLGCHGWLAEKRENNKSEIFQKFENIEDMLAKLFKFLEDNNDLYRGGQCHLITCHGVAVKVSFTKSIQVEYS